MKAIELFKRGDRVRIKVGLFTGRDGEVIESWRLMAPDLPWDRYRLTIQTRSFDGSKVIVHLESDEVEIIAASKTDG
jgi:hypothetical protein